MNKMTLLLLVISCLVLLAGNTSHATPDIAELQAKSPKLGTVIVYATNAIEPEKMAAEDLKNYLSKITGTNYSLQTEDKLPSGTSAIYVGQTAFASKSDLDFTQFTEEEYALRTVGSNFIIGGGQPNGTLNGVNYFLTRILGCRFFAWDNEVIPHQENILLPKLDVRRKPSFSSRHIYIPVSDLGYTPDAMKKVTSYLNHNSFNAYRSVYDRLSIATYATQAHNSYFWVDPRNYAISNPEFFSNKKFNMPLWPHNQEGQLCFTNPEIWNITLNKLREIIKTDRATLPKWKWPITYQISQNDNQKYCQLPNYQIEVKTAGDTQAGPLLQYVNFVAEAIAKEYPDVKIMTLAYVDSEKPPNNIKPADNVIIQWADLYSRSDCYRPLTSKFNAGQLAILNSWRKTGAKLAVWDYWNMGNDHAFFSTPRVEIMIDAIAPDLRLLSESGVDMFFTQAMFDSRNPQNFFDLQVYLGLQLAEDVTLPEEALIKEYMTAYYGSATPAMNEFLTLLRQSIKNEKLPLFYTAHMTNTYTDGVFLEKVYKLLKKAQAAVPLDSDYYRRVQQEMITPLAVILQNPQYDFFQRTGLKKEVLATEYRAARLSRIEQSWITVERQKQDKVQLEEDMNAMLLNIPTPEHLKHCQHILKFAYPQMKFNGAIGSIEPDSYSSVGKAMVARSRKDKEEPLHDINKPFAGGNFFGIYSLTDKRSANSITTNVPLDEKYHWYKLDAFDFGPNTILWGFYWFTTVNLSSAFTHLDGLPDNNVWETWISVKYIGPAYVKNSTQKNGVFLDQVILVKPDKCQK